MAKNTLPVNFQDDILNSAMGGKRRFKLIPNSDGTYSLEDVTTYDQVGSNFGAGQINATNQAVNESADKNKVIQDIEAIRNVIEDGYIAGALALKHVDDSLEEQPQFVYDENGQITGYTTKIGGADTVFPFRLVNFKYGGKLITTTNSGYSTIVFPDKCSFILVFSVNTSSVGVLGWYDINSGKAYRLPNDTDNITEYEVGEKDNSLSFKNKTANSIQIKHYNTQPIMWLYL